MLSTRLFRKRQISIVLAMVILAMVAYGYWLLVGPKHVAQPSKTVSVLSLNLAACRSGETYSQSQALGSSSATILKSEGDFCLTSVNREIEGGYNIFECLVPKNASLFQNEHPAGLLEKGYKCKEIRSGNFLPEQ